MAIFCMLCGLPSSGKSYIAKEEISKQGDFVICSSDEIREELFGDIYNQNNNEEVFNILHQRVKENLKNGKNVIYDACNINSRRRRAFLKELKGIPCEKYCIVAATTYEECLRSNKLRDRTVPEEVIEKMYRNWTMPYFFEGWDDIIIGFKTGTKKLKPFDWANKYMTYNQDNPHHTMSLGEHSICVANNFEDNNTLYYAGLLHDCGKPFTKFFKESNGEIGNEAVFYNHENCGAYDSLFFDYPEGVNIGDVSILINLHMIPFQWEHDKEHGEKTREKYRKLWGEKLYQDVMKLHEADKKAK